MKLFVIISIFMVNMAEAKVSFNSKRHCSSKILNLYANKIKPDFKGGKKKKLIKDIVKAGKKYNVDCALILVHLKVESDFDQTVINPFTGEVSIAQINYGVWHKEFKKYNRRLSKKKLIRSQSYAVDNMAFILSVYRSSHGKKDPLWYARYNSGLYVYKLEYLNYLAAQFKKVRLKGRYKDLADYFIDYKEKRRLMKSVAKKYGHWRLLEIYTRTENKEKTFEKYANRFKKSKTKKVR